ncbi:hypothetical protein FHU33_1066 [Blastococcus colisei]|uniref:Uncharacterized protein n=1 Tax=Blastococcus colisei TaxID=1564162 RepID=A0A543PCA7_9ACTN|nr:hypothetical protein [Blastococcus colisei]TQN41689.1 hypothetical protein FHU33_1066 [Blastococcus colisei]
MIIFLALTGVLVIGLMLGLLWHSTVLIGDRRALDRLASHLAAEQLIQARTHDTLRAMRDAAHNQWQRGSGGAS